MGWGSRSPRPPRPCLAFFFFPPSKCSRMAPFLRLNSPCRGTRRNDHPSSRRSLADVRSLLSSRQWREAVNPKHRIVDYHHLVSLIFPLLMDNRDIHDQSLSPPIPMAFKVAVSPESFAYHNNCARCYQRNSASSGLFGGRVIPIS